ncbi:TetR family transcriptional regulator [Longimycelium tulufanense]|uniref:TetR family transcriptional regulator n=1 Tax=Longimycelium tulufanense TaxID=907463 RepID=A0A8J3CIT1_9PSEU|nr:TetR/AcrR family transcriptional regulator [Longimycelium tulufanense]GGM72992.1 TetR family transcriptional regulator [Longimycelium tulufanense]
MGNREDLLAGAKRCLYEKGYGRTTARDIATAAGTSLAAIGYHFGSTRALLNAAMVEAFDDWGEELEGILPPAEGDLATSLETTWTRMTESLTRHRALWVASFEAFIHSEDAPELREQLATGYELVRRGMAAALRGVTEDEVDEGAMLTVGSAQLALLVGLMVQWLIDPGRAPSGRDLVQGLRELAARLEGGAGEPTK